MLYYEYGSTSEKRQTDEVLDRDQTNRSLIITLIITQNLALLIRLVTEQEEAEVLCLMQGVELELHSRLHLRTLPPSPESRSAQRNIEMQLPTFSS